MLECWKDLLLLTGRLHELCAVAPEIAGQLTLAQARVVKFIYMRAPEPVILKDVAEELAITPSAVSQMVDVLVRQNLVERLPSPNDRRAVILRPTEWGEHYRQEHNAKAASLMRRLCGSVAAEKISVFADVLARLRAEADALWSKRNGSGGEHTHSSVSETSSASPEPDQEAQRSK